MQGAIEAAIATVTGGSAAVAGAGRTDAGVHAIGQVAHFDTGWTGTPERLQQALNAVLDRDVAVLDLSEVPGTFHARFGAVARWYRYRIWASPLRHPLEERFSYHVASDLDVERMAGEALALVGDHDFGGFGIAPAREGSTVRTVNAAHIAREGGVVTFDVIANGFLRHQVRRTVGLLVDIGRGALPAGALAAVRDRLVGAPVPRRAPAKGLALIGVAYSVDGDGPRWEPSLDIHGTAAGSSLVRFDGRGST